MAKTAKPEEEGNQPDNGQPRRLSALDRIIGQAIGEDRTLGLPDDPAKVAYPTLWDWLSRIYVGRDHVKNPATLTIALGPEGVLATLTDRDLGVSFGVGCGHLDKVLATLEAALSGPHPPMRSWGRREPKVRKRKSGN
jgi:hypothetical protein